MSGPLAGLKVIDVTEGAQGPWAAALLADLGCDVIKVEKPDGDFMRPGPVFKGMNHGKRDICLYLKDDEDREILYALVRTADVFMENWRPGVARRLGVDYATLWAMNPGLVYVSASGFGQQGRYGPKASMENTSAAMGGYAILSGPAGGLGEKPRTQVIDFASPLPVLQGVLLALLHRRESSRGQWIQCSQLQTLAHIQSVRISEYLMSGQKPEPMGSAVPYTVPSQAFKTADWYLYVDTRTEADWQALCGVLRLSDLAQDARFDSNARRVAAREELIPQLERAFVRFGVRHWLSLLAEAGVPCSAINMDLEDLYADPQVVAGQMIAMRPDDVFGSIRTNDVAWEFSRTPAAYGRVLAAKLGDDRESVLAEIPVAGGVA